MISMTAARKVKISVSIDAQLLGLVDRSAANEGATRSAVMERWLRQASRQARAARLEEETAAYYDALTGEEKTDDAAWAAASSIAARRLRVDDASPTRSARRGRGRG